MENEKVNEEFLKQNKEEFQDIIKSVPININDLKDVNQSINDLKYIKVEDLKYIKVEVVQNKFKKIKKQIDDLLQDNESKQIKKQIDDLLLKQIKELEEDSHEERKGDKKSKKVLKQEEKINNKQNNELVTILQQEKKENKEDIEKTQNESTQNKNPKNMTNDELREFRTQCNIKFLNFIKEEFMKNNDFLFFVKNALRVEQIRTSFSGKDGLTVLDVAVALNIFDSKNELEVGCITIGNEFLNRMNKALLIMSGFGFYIPRKFLYSINNCGDAINGFLTSISTYIQGLTNNKVELDIAVQYPSTESIPRVINHSDSFLIKEGRLYESIPRSINHSDSFLIKEGRLYNNEQNGEMVKMISEKNALFLLWMELEIGVIGDRKNNVWSEKKESGKMRHIYFEPMLILVIPYHRLFNVIHYIKSCKLDQDNVSFDREIGSYEYQVAKMIKIFSAEDVNNRSVTKGIEIIRTEEGIKKFFRFVLQTIKDIVIKETNENLNLYNKTPELHKAKSFCPFQKALYYLERYKNFIYKKDGDCAKFYKQIDEGKIFDEYMKKMIKNNIKNTYDFYDLIIDRYIPLVNQTISALNLSEHENFKSKDGVYLKYRPLIISIASSKFLSFTLKDSKNELLLNKQSFNMIMQDVRIQNPVDSNRISRTVRDNPEMYCFFERNKDGTPNLNPNRSSVQKFIVDAIVKCAIQHSISLLQLCEMIFYKCNSTDPFAVKKQMEKKLDDTFNEKMENLNTSFKNMTKEGNLLGIAKQEPIDMRFMSKSLIFLLFDKVDSFPKTEEYKEEKELNPTVHWSQTDGQMFSYAKREFLIKQQSALPIKQENAEIGFTK